MAVNSDPIMTWSFIRKCEPSDAILDVLVPGERVLQCYATVRDKAALTDKRIIFTDVQGITGKKKEVYSIPYRSIDMWSSENTGHFDLDAELDLWTKAGNFTLKVAAKCDIREFDQILGSAILNQ